MATVAEVINRIYREWLHAPSDQPIRAILTSGIDNSTTTVPLTTTTLSPEAIDLLGEGVVLEIDSEQMLVTAWSSPNATVVRGWANTTKATHAANAEVFLAPDFPRLSVFEAVCDAVVDLYPDLFQVLTVQYTSQDTPLDIAANVIEVIRYLYPDTSTVTTNTVWKEGWVELLRDFPASATDVGLQFRGIPDGRAGYLTYAAMFDRPTDETDDLNDGINWGVSEDWTRIVMVDAVSQLIATHPVRQSTLDRLADVLASEGYTAQDANAVRNGLIALRNEWVRRAQHRIRARYPIRVKMRR